MYSLLAYPFSYSLCLPFSHRCIRLMLRLIVPQGILDAYHYTLHNVKLHGPTNFSSILDRTMQYASVQENQQSQNYFILLVITVSSILQWHGGTCSSDHCMCRTFACTGVWVINHAMMTHSCDIILCSCPFRMERSPTWPILWTG